MCCFMRLVAYFVFSDYFNLKGFLVKPFKLGFTLKGFSWLFSWNNQEKKDKLNWVS